MSSQWGSLLTDGEALQAFEADLRDRLSNDYEVEDELVNFVLGSVKQIKDKQQLAAEFTDTFEDDAAEIAAWCWAKLTELSQQAATADTSLDEIQKAADFQGVGSEEGELAASGSPTEPSHEEQPSKKPKREPIKFKLDNAAAATAPTRASTHKAEQLKPSRANEADRGTAGGAQHATQQQAPSRSRSEVVRGSAAGVKGALAAAARSAAAVADSKSSKELPAVAAEGTRGRGRHREQSPPAAATAQAVQPARTSPRAQQVQGSVRQQQHAGSSRPADQTREPPARAAAVKRSLADGVAVGARGIASRALQQIGAVAAGGAIRGDRAAKRRQQQQQPQQQPQRREAEPQQEQPTEQLQEQQPQQRQQRGSRVSVLDRLGSRESQDDGQKGSGKHSVFERLSGLAPGAPSTQPAGQETGEPAAAAEVPDRRELLQQQQRHTDGGVQGSKAAAKVQRRSIVSRLEGAGSGAAEEQQMQEEQQQQPQPGQPAAAGMAAAAPQQAATVVAGDTAALGTKRKAPPAATAVNGTTAAASTAAVKKPATAAAPGAKSQQAAEFAALRAKLAAKEAEIKRLQQQKALQQQQQEADERSVVVFNVGLHIPEPVVRAHFSGCGAIKRCTLLPRAPGPNVPGAYIEFESSTAVLAAMGLHGTSLVDQQIQVARKSDYKANQQKGRQTFAQLRAAAGKSWVKPLTAPTAIAGPSGGGDESPTSLGSMGLAE